MNVFVEILNVYKTAFKNSLFLLQYFYWFYYI